MSSAMKSISVINGPNLNLLGTRQPHIYGSTTLQEIEAQIREAAATRGYEIRSFQSNSEGALIDEIQTAQKHCTGMIINAGAYTHTSIGIADALHSFSGPIVEVHLSNIFAREQFRRHSYISPVAAGVISGFGAASYALALEALITLLARGTEK